MPYNEDDDLGRMEDRLRALGVQTSPQTVTGGGPFNYSFTGLPLPASLGGGMMSPVNRLGGTGGSYNLAAELAYLAGHPQIIPQAAPGPVTYPQVSTGPQGVTPLQAGGLESMYGPLPSGTPIRTPSPQEKTWEDLVSVTAQPTPITNVPTLPPIQPQPSQPPPDANVPGPPADANTGQPLDIDALIAAAAAGMSGLSGGGGGSSAASGSYPVVGGGGGYESLFGLPVPRAPVERGRARGR